MLFLRPTKEPLVLTRSPADWQAYLADPEKHWTVRRSAKMVAEAWEGARPDLSPEVRRALAGTAFESFRPHRAVPEYGVELTDIATTWRTEKWVTSVGAVLRVPP